MAFDANCFPRARVKGQILIRKIDLRITCGDSRIRRFPFARVSGGQRKLESDRMFLLRIRCNSPLVITFVIVTFQRHNIELGLKQPKFFQ